MNISAPRSRRICNDFSQLPFAPIGIMATPGGRDLAEKIDAQLVIQRKALAEIYPRFEDCPGFLRESYIIDCDMPRFGNGEGKAVINESIRGFELYFITDIGNSGVSYTRNGVEVSMSPDEHYQDVKRLISATRGLGYRNNVILPLLYESRQHKVSGRESLDCAMALQELVAMGAVNIMTIDAHNSHVQNAIPNCDFENLHANYQQIKTIVNTENKFKAGIDDLIVTSPDLGGMERCRYFAEQLQADLTVFYKLRDLSRIVDGKNPIIEHKFLGGNVEGKDALIVDDLIASGESMLDVAKNLKQMGTKRIFMACTFPLFTEGIERFDKAFEDGIFDRLYGTNATYNHPELLKKDWYVSVDVSRLIALYIDSFNRNESASRLLDNTLKIHAVLERKGVL
ncbi:MAG: ribose-phosphate pyrophosphokinase [Chlamydiae bacterium]|nr:MAG: ribose-phosphate pyrophosphokinase [Chlamydiota bacterium]